MDKMTLSQLSMHLAKSTGYKQEFCEQFVAELFRLIRDGLIESGSVNVTSLGQFFVTDDNVCYEPANGITDIVNAPFSFFEAEELSDDFDTSLLDANQDVDLSTSDMHDVETEDNDISNESDQDSEISTESVIENASEISDSEDISSSSPEVPEDEAVHNHDESEIQADSTSSFNYLSEDNTIEDINDDESIQAAEYKKKPVRALTILWLLLAFVLGFVTCYYLCKSEVITINITQDANPIIDEITTNDDIAIEDNSTTPLQTGEDTIDTIDIPELQEEPVIETVTSTNYLAAMSRRHYGRYEFWVYIYLENKDILGHPDRIEPNTKVVIPPASKYNIDKDNPESVNKALNLASELYAPYK